MITPMVIMAMITDTIMVTTTITAIPIHMVRDADAVMIIHMITIIAILMTTIIMTTMTIATAMVMGISTNKSWMTAHRFRFLSG